MAEIIAYVEEVNDIPTTIEVSAATPLPVSTTPGSGTQDVEVVVALPAGTNNIGDVDIASALPAGDNNIGNVDLASAIPAGTNNIGDVDVLTLPTVVVGGTGINAAATATPALAVAADADAVVAAAAGLRLLGYSVKEVGAAAASFEIVNGATGAAGALLIPVALVADEVRTVWLGHQGIASAAGLSVDHLAGTFDIVLYHSTV